MIAIDTNVLIGAMQTFDPTLRSTARDALKKLHRQDEQLLCFPQNLIEFWSASTRPSQANGLGLTTDQAARCIDRFQTLIRLLPEIPAIFPTWRHLVAQHGVSGIKVHDARIVAAMHVYQIRKLLTFDLEDFKRYPEISVIHPESLK